jgi:UDP-N-acetylmuramate--alanine ligase
METDKLNSIFFIGIGGIGMSALARYFHEKDVDVSGYDKTPTWLTQQLIADGIFVTYEDKVAYPEKHYDLVIYTPAIGEDNAQLKYFRSNGYVVKKRAEVLAEITREKFTIAIAGTHGKTTIASMVAHILHEAGKEMTAFVGGICKNYDSNYISNGDNGWIIVEADEFDRSFLQLHPNHALISSIDPDHLDVYETMENLIDAFSQFTHNIHKDGSLLMWYKTKLNTPDDLRHYSFSLNEDSDYKAVDIKDLKTSEKFSIRMPDRDIKDITLNMPGLHNIGNAVAAAAICSINGIGDEKIRDGLTSYSGVRRRLDVRWMNGAVYIDDYAHHPEELTAAIDAVKRMYPDKKITGVFQPHLYSRTHDLADGFASSLEALDELILLDIYPAREEPIPGVSSGIIFNKISNQNKTLIQKSRLMELLWEKDIQVLLTLGAGDIDQFVEPIEKMLSQRFS